MNLIFLRFLDRNLLKWHRKGLCPNELSCCRGTIAPIGMDASLPVQPARDEPSFISADLFSNVRTQDQEFTENPLDEEYLVNGLIDFE